MNRRERIVAIGAELTSLRDQVRSTEAHLGALHSRLEALEFELDQLLSDTDEVLSDGVAVPEQGDSHHRRTEVMEHLDVSAGRKRKRFSISMFGTARDNLTLKDAMLEVARRAVLEGNIHPLQLRMHHGTINAKTRWKQLKKVATPETIEKEISNPERWFTNCPIHFGGETWILTNQWSFDEAYGSSKDDLNRIQREFPKLNLLWSYT